MSQVARMALSATFGKQLDSIPELSENIIVYWVFYSVSEPVRQLIMSRGGCRCSSGKISWAHEMSPLLEGLGPFDDTE